MTSHKYWISPVPIYDDFGNIIEDEFIDGRSVAGRWAIFTPRAWLKYGCGKFGTGCGQHYHVQPETGKFIKIKG